MSDVSWQKLCDENERLRSKNDQLRDRLSIALAFAEHLDFATVQVGPAMIPRDVWIDAATRWLDIGGSLDPIVAFSKGPTP